MGKASRSVGIAAIAGLATLASGIASAGTFPDFGFKPPENQYDGELFRLSQDYPQQPGQVPAFFELLPLSPGQPHPVSSDYGSWQPYLAAVKQYCLEGNVETQWAVQKNPKRRWYHMPWQHYGPAGREGIHGLTKEAEIQPQQLAHGQADAGQTYAVGIYNDIGGYTIGQVWKDPMNPDPSVTSEPNSFLHGTVVCKALFADVKLEQVPFLVNPVVWDGYITESFTSSVRSVRPVALIQMDFAVRDDRIPGTGWVFGTFQYNGTVTGAPGWDNLVPVGVMWGNDPQVTGNGYTNPQPTRTRINPALQQTVINPGDDLPPTHLGWNGRLNGPVDNPVSSCMSCHLTGEAPQLSPMNPTFQPNPPPIGSDAWMRWFQNEPAGVPFDQAARSTDYSLQLAAALANFYDWKCDESGVFADGPNACQRAGGLRLSNKRANDGEVFRVQRGPQLEDLDKQAD